MIVRGLFGKTKADRVLEIATEISKGQVSHLTSESPEKIDAAIRIADYLNRRDPRELDRTTLGYLRYLSMMPRRDI